MLLRRCCVTCRVRGVARRCACGRRRTRVPTESGPRSESQGQRERPERAYERAAEHRPRASGRRSEVVQDRDVTARAAAPAGAPPHRPAGGGPRISRASPPRRPRRPRTAVCAAGGRGSRAAHAGPRRSARQTTTHRPTRSVAAGGNADRRRRTDRGGPDGRFASPFVLYILHGRTRYIYRSRIVAREA